MNDPNNAPAGTEANENTNNGTKVNIPSGTNWNNPIQQPIYITDIEFAYDIFIFKKDKTARTYIPTRLYNYGVMQVLENAGYYKREISPNQYLFTRKLGRIISAVTPERIKDYLRRYVAETFIGPVSFTYGDEAYNLAPETFNETFLKNSHNVANETWLQQLPMDDEPILKDTACTIFFAFRSGIVAVTKEGIEYKDWPQFTGSCVWEEQVINRSFTYTSDNTSCHFYRFLQNVTNSDVDRLTTMRSAIGYMLHHYFRESEGQAVIFYDEEITDTKKPMGGSGKGLIANALKQVRSIAPVDGKHFDANNRFRWSLVKPSTQIVWLDDVKPDFDFSTLHSNLTDGWTVEEKNKNQFLIPPAKSPKTMICSNSIIQGGGTTNIRRQFVVELSNFYSRQIIIGNEKPIEETHGGLFFSTDWSRNEWNMFFSVLMDAGQMYLSKGLKPHKGVNHAYNKFRQATDEDFAQWAEINLLANVRHDSIEYFSRYVGLIYGDSHVKLGRRIFSNYVKEFAAYKRWTYQSKESNGRSYFILNSG